MSKTLVLAEKPSVGADIARVIGAKQKRNGYYEGDKYIVTWALGHLVTLSDPEVYSKEYKSWNLEHLPIIPKKLTLVPIPQTIKQYKTVTSQMLRKDVDTIVIATDAGREGELVARWILEKAHINKKVKRLWISSVTDSAIRDGFKNLHDGSKYINLYKSAVARAESDWLVGINCTRGLTTKYNAQLSCGRVQTPTLSIIQAKEEEIKKFVPKKYYEIHGYDNKINFTWLNKGEQARCFDVEKVDAIIDKIKNAKGIIQNIEKKIHRKMPPKLYDLTELQRDGNKIFGFSAKETLSIMQKLYEQHKVLTYPRTDSRYISTDIVPTLQVRLKACGGGTFRKFTSKIISNGIKVNNNFVDNSKVSDHHAIIPTEQYVDYSKFNDKERKIYDLVVKRFIAVMLEPYEYEEKKVLVRVEGETFVAKGITDLKMGFKEVYGEILDKGQQKLPNYEKSKPIEFDSLKKSEGYTSPPPRFNEASLLSAMENPTKYLTASSNEMAKTLTETGGLGTVATRADIIEKLFNSFLIEKRGNDIYITNKGTQLLELVPEDLKSPDLTGKWEQKLNDISKCKIKKEDFIAQIKSYTETLLKEIKSSNHNYIHDNITNTRCPECDKPMLDVHGKKGKLLVCQDRECGFRKSLSITINARCPVCKKKLEIVGDGEGKRVVCKCGHREKYTAFQKRMDQYSNKANKNDVKKYIEEQKKKEASNKTGNSAFQALSGFKLD